MKWLIPLVAFVISSSLQELQEENVKLRKTNSSLHNQLLKLSTSNNVRSAVVQDFNFNKQKLSSLVNQYQKQTDIAIKISLADQIQQLIKAIIEDIQLLGGEVEGISASQLQGLLEQLVKHTDKTRESQQAQQFASVYNELQIELDRKQQSVRSLQLQNAKLLGKLDSAQAELEHTVGKYDYDKQKLTKVNKQLQTLRKDQQKRLQLIKQSLQSEEKAARAKEIEEFKQIQTSQDKLISDLQQLSAQQSLSIQQLTVDKANLNSKLRLLNNTIDRLQSELTARSSQLQAAQAKFEQFRKQVQTDTNDQISSLRNSEIELKQQVFDLQQSQISLLEQLANCTKQLDHYKLLDRQKSNKIKQLKLEMEQASHRIEQAKTARSQQIQNLHQKLEHSQQELHSLQSQLDDTLHKVSLQNADLRKLTSTLENSKFLSENSQKEDSLFVHSSFLYDQQQKMSNQIVPSASASLDHQNPSSSSSSSESEEEQIRGVTAELVENMIPKGGTEPIEESANMHVNEFTLGQNLGVDQYNQLPPVKAKETAFIPLSVAINYVEKVNSNQIEDDMRKMHENNKSLLIQLDECYGNIEKQTQEKYKSFIDKWKSQSENRYGGIRAAYEQEKQNNKELRVWADDNIKELQRKISELSQEKNKLLRELNSSVQNQEVSSQEVYKAVETDYSKQILLVQNQKTALEKELAELEKMRVKEICGLEVDLMVTQVEASGGQPIVVSTPIVPDFSQQLAASQRENAQLLEKLAIAQNSSIPDTSKYQKEIEKLKLQMQEQKNHLQAQISGLQEERDNVKKELKAMQDNWQDAQDSDNPQLVALRAQLMFANNQLNQKREEATNLKAENEELNGAIGIYAEQEKQLKQKLQLAQKVEQPDFSKFEQQIDKLSLQLQEQKNHFQAQISGLQEQRDNVKKELKAMQDNWQDAQDSDNPQLVALRAQLMFSNNELNQKRQQATNLKTENGELSGTIGIYDEQEKKLKEKLEKAKRKIKELKEKIVTAPIATQSGPERVVYKEVVKQVPVPAATVSGDDHHYKKKYENKKHKNKHLKKEIEKLKEKLKSLASVPAAMLVSQPGDDQQKVELRNQLQASQAQLQNLQNQISLLQQADTSDQLKQAKLELEAAQKQIQELLSRPAAVVKKKSSSSSSSKSKRSGKAKPVAVITPEVDVQSLRNQIGNLKSHIATLQQENEKLQLSIVPPGESKQDALRAQLEQKLDELQETRRNLKQVTDEMESLKEKLAKAQQDLADSHSNRDQQIHKLKKNIGDLEDQHKKKLQELEQNSSSALRDAQAEFNQVSQQLANLTKEKEGLQKQLENSNQQIAKSNKEIENLRKVAGEAQALTAQVAALTASVNSLQESNAQKEQELKDSIRQRKLLHNQLEDLKGKIRVFCRVRPMSRTQVQKECTNITSISDEFTINCETKQGQIKPFLYDSVFGPNSTQQDVFEDTRRLVQSAIDGYNVCIFAYGQTGSGKTYTIQGEPSNPGITPRAIQQMFDILNSMPGHYQWQVSCYMVELYLDNLVDLFLPREMRAQAPTLNIKKDVKGMVVIPEAHQYVVTSPEELMSRFEQGNSFRHTSATKMNDVSSRSHLIFGVLIDVTNKETQQRTVGKLSLVDLAGSERVSKTDATAQRLKEGRAINKSLTALGDVISALSSGESHIPYRNNKLTMIMSDSLGGTAKTLMFVNVSPASYNREEILMSLYYAARVKLITNEPTKNVETKEMSKMKQEILDLGIERDKLRLVLERSGLSSADIERLAIQQADEGDFDDPKYDEL